MCGRYNVIDSPEVQTLMEQLGLPGVTPRPQHNVPPGGIGEFVIEAADDQYLLPGIWSLLIEPNPNGYGFRPNPKFHTFNARSELMRTHTSAPLVCEPVRSTKLLELTGETELIPADT